MADRLSKPQRSALMSRIRGRHAGIEKTVLKMLRANAVPFRTYAKHLPGNPDIVISGVRVAVFVDGDFWHAYRYPTWKHTLAPFWQKKIEGNRRRDRRNFAKLRRMGWSVIKVRAMKY